MKKVLCLLVACMFVLPAFDSAEGRDVRVKGYYRKDGTYVQPHHRTSPDHNPYNNYSTPGNTNPYTGKTAGSSNSWGTTNQWHNSNNYNNYNNTWNNSRGW